MVYNAQDQPEQGEAYVTEQELRKLNTNISAARQGYVVGVTVDPLARPKKKKLLATHEKLEELEERLQDEANGLLDFDDVA